MGKGTVHRERPGARCPVYPAGGPPSRRFFQKGNGLLFRRSPAPEDYNPLRKRFADDGSRDPDHSLRPLTPGFSGPSARLSSSPVGMPLMNPSYSPQSPAGPAEPGRPPLEKYAAKLNILYSGYDVIEGLCQHAVQIRRNLAALHYAIHGRKLPHCPSHLNLQLFSMGDIQEIAEYRPPAFVFYGNGSKLNPAIASILALHLGLVDGHIRAGRLQTAYAVQVIRLGQAARRACPPGSPQSSRKSLPAWD